MSLNHPDSFQPEASPPEETHLPSLEVSKRLAAEMLTALDEAIAKEEISLGKAFDLFTEMDTPENLKHCHDQVAVKLFAILKAHTELGGNLSVVGGEAFSIFKTKLFKKFHNQTGWKNKLMVFLVS